MVENQEHNSLFEFHVIFVADNPNENGDFYVYADIGTSKILDIGAYPTKEIAKKVISLIAEAGSQGNAVFVMPGRDEPIDEKSFAKGHRTKSQFFLLKDGEDAVLHTPKLIFCDFETKNDSTAICASFCIEDEFGETFDIIIGTYADKETCLAHFEEIVQAYADDKPLFILGQP